MQRQIEETLRKGDVVGRYRVIERIGGGGMGDVYRARDVELDRDVALKVLPADVVHDEERVRRFVQEAKTASALNHPNIITVYEIGTASNVPYIAMELVDGETFRAKIQRTPRDLKSLLGFAAQAADALAKAHASGIVHRDLKPDNLMVTRDGFTKVLDFGLAKLTEPRSRPEVPDGPTEVRPQTREGLVMGTAGYMSPEQAEGRAVDHRSDIFSFGCILYEAATGQRPFAGRTEVDVLHAILNSDPRPITETNPSAPAELRRIVRRCLAKDPDQRIQSMKDLANTLRDLVDEFDQLTPGSGTSAPVARAAERHRLPWFLAAIALVSSALLGGWALMRERGGAPSAPAEKKPLTLAAITSTGKAMHGCLSPDGRYLAYNVVDGQKVALRIRQLATGSEVELFPLSEETYYVEPQYSPDGNYLYARRNVRGSSVSTLVSVPALGGTPRELVRDMLGKVSFSPDGKQIVFVRRSPKTGSTVHIADADGGNERLLIRRHFDQLFSETPAWSPDGKWIAVAHRDLTGGLHTVLLVVSPDGKTVRPFARDRWFFVHRLAWLPDMRAIAMTGQLTDTRQNQMWLLSWPEGTARRVTSDLSWYGTFSVAPDGKSLIATQGDSRSGVWRVDRRRNAVQEVTDTELRADPGAGFVVGKSGRMYYYGYEEGTSDIFAINADGTKTRLTSLPGAEFAPAPSPDEQTIYYQYEMGERFELHAITATGAGRRIVAQLPPIDAVTVMAPDGRSVLLSGASRKVIVPLDGGPQTNLQLPTGHPLVAFSPDGTRIVGFFRLGLEEGQRMQLAIFPATGGKPLRVFERSPTQIAVRGVVWTRDGRHLAYVDGTGGTENLWIEPVDGGTPKPLTSFRDQRLIEAIAAGPEDSLYLVRIAYLNDIVRISDF